MADHIVIIGGGPGGYEAAHVAAQLGAEVTVVDTDGIGGSAVLTDCVPSKTLIATSELMTELAGAPELGVSFEDQEGDAAARAHADHVLTVPVVATLHSPFVATVPLQMLAAGIALARGYDIDKPRNLAKSVTVE